MSISVQGHLFRSLINLTLLLIFLTTLYSCSSLNNLAKSDIDFVADAHLNEMNRLLKILMVKLYKRNPGELRKYPNHSIESRRSQIFLREGDLKFAELNYKEGVQAILLCFDEEYQGDRVFALMVGLTGMIRKSYNNKTEFYIIDDLDQQKLYNSARNLEIILWRLKNKRDSKGRPFLITNELNGRIDNLSFERIFGKMIAIQDMMAMITADKTNRAINKVVHSMATAAFMPIGY
jgi:hypothetical protein